MKILRNLRSAIRYYFYRIHLVIIITKENAISQGECVDLLTTAEVSLLSGFVLQGTIEEDIGS